MPEEQEDERRVATNKTTWERHAATIMTGLILAIGTVGMNEIISQGKLQREQTTIQLLAQTKMQGEMNAISIKLEHLKELLKSTSEDNWTATQDKSAMTICRSRVDRVEARLRRLEDFEASE